MRLRTYLSKSKRSVRPARGGDKRLTGENPMKSLKLWSLVLALAVGNLMGCSRVPTKSLDVSHGILAGREIAESRQEVPPKPSPCITWDNAPRRLGKPLRKAKDAAVSRDSQHRLQAKNENQPHI